MTEPLKFRTIIKNHRDGFSLLELSISLMVLSLLLGGALTIASDHIAETNTETDAEKLAVIQQALADFAERNNRLPCVASRDAVFGDGDLAREILYDDSPAADCSTDTTEPAGTDRAETSGGSGVYVRIGAVPTRDLLIRDEYMYDSRNNRFTYIVTENLTNATHYAANGGGALTVNDGTGQNVLTDAAYIVLTHGPDGKGAYIHATGAEKTACGASANLDVENCDGDGTFTSALYNDGEVEAKYFDDQIAMLSKASVDTPADEGEAEEPALQTTFLPLVNTNYRWGYAAYNWLGDLNGDGYDDIVIVGVNGMVVYHGKATMPSLVQVPAEVNSNVTSNTAHAAIGDFDGDGVDDMAIVTHGTSQTTRVVFGTLTTGLGSGTVNFNALATSPTGFGINAVAGSYNYNLGAGDVDGDGIDDLIVNCSYGCTNSLGETGAGGFAIFFGRARGSWASSYNYTDANVIIQGKDWVFNGLGLHEIRTIDMDGDGIKDIVHTNGTTTGITFGRLTADWPAVRLITDDRTANQTMWVTNFTNAVTHVCKLDGDAYPDIIGRDGKVLRGRAKASWAGSALNYTTQTLGTQKFEITDLPALTGSGDDVGCIDMTGDGLGEAIITRANSSNPGYAWMIFGRSSFGNGISVATPDGTSVTKFTGAFPTGNWAARYWLNRNMAVGDINADGYGDFVLGAGSAASSVLHQDWAIYGMASGWPAEVDLADYLP